MAAASDKTGPIELPRRRRFREAEDQPVERQRGVSQLIESICSETLEIGRAEGKPSDTQIARLTDDVELLRHLATRGAQIADDAAAAMAAGGGNGGKNSILTMLAAVVMAAGVSLGVPGLTSTDDAAEAKVIAQANDERLTKVEERQQDEERRARRIQGLTVRWLGDTQEAYCQGLLAIANGVNKLADGQSPKKDSPKTGDPLDIDCKLATLPPELVRLEADLEIEERSQ